MNTQNLESEVYIWLTDDNQIAAFKTGIKNEKQSDFTAFIKSAILSLNQNRPVPQGWLLRYELPAGLVTKEDTLSQFQKKIAEWGGGRLNPPVQVIPLRKAVFCEQNRINYFSPLNKGSQNMAYSKFLTSNTLKYTDEQKNHTEIRPTVRQFPKQQSHILKMK